MSNTKIAAFAVLLLSAGLALVTRQIVVGADATAPVTIANVEETVSGAGMLLKYDVVNHSGKGVAAYVTCVRFARQGTAIGETDHVRVAADDLTEILSHSLGPGTMETVKTRIPPATDGIPTTYQVTVEYVLFEDGSTWGPSVDKFSERVIGLENGYRAAYSELRGTLRSQGIAGVKLKLEGIK